MSERSLARRGHDGRPGHDGRRGYEARPGRIAVVVSDLAELHGPTTGVAVLPNRLFWQPDHAFDLDDDDSLTWMYENVLREAARLDELRMWIDGPTLARLWPTMFVPQGVRTAWESRHPGLRDISVLVG